MKPTPEVADELIALCRELWSANEIPLRAAQRFVGRLVPVGTPAASVAEIGRYLRAVAKTHRVKTAGCPIAVACMPDEFGAWLARARSAVHVQPARVAPRTDPALSPAETGMRAAAIMDHLARCFPNEPQILDSPKTVTMPRPEIVSDVGT